MEESVMDFEVLDKKMRVYEESLDQFIPPDTFLVARLDGRGFSRLTKYRDSRLLITVNGK